MKKTAVITGSTRGIGLAIAVKLAKDDCNIVMIGTRERGENLDAIATVSKAGAEVLFIQADVSKEEDREKIVVLSRERFGKIDIFVSNAGVAPKERKDLLEMDESSFDRLIAINTKGPLFLAQMIAREMLTIPRNERDCTMVFITSCSSVVSSISRGEYCISKAAETMVARLFADRLASEGILVHEVRPGVIATDMTQVVTEKYDKMFASGAFPIRRWGTGEDVANVVSAFCSGLFGYSTGDVIDVDGGFHIPRL